MYDHLLFDHKYDIDDIILILCGDDHTGRWLLSTRDGRVVKETDTSDTHHINDGDDAGHWHHIEPLPLSFIHELKTHEKRNHLSAEDTAKLDDILENTQALHTLPQHFANERVGGWLRERIKEAAMEWLDMREMIPPSMQHVYDVQAAPQGGTQTKVTIDPDA